jgi:hypothetical protein
VRLWHPEQFGLPSGDGPVEFGVAEQSGTRAELVNLCRLALRLETERAHEATAARNVERHDDAIADGDRGDVSADFAHDAHRLVAKDVALRHERSEHLIEVEI